MPIESPQLDDLRFDRIKEELIRRIPVYTNQWTDHNDSDPGITMIQLFSFLTEQVGYRLNQIPEKNHIELLKLLGIQLKTAHAAKTQLAFFLSNPAAISGFTLTVGSRAKTKEGDPPPTFETDEDIDVVPAEPAVLITTKSTKIWDLLHGLPDPTEEQMEDEVTPEESPWHTIVWDGKKPKFKDWPVEPFEVFPNSDQTYLWVGLNFNSAFDAGFRGVRVTLTVQFDDDEQPDLEAIAKCEPMVSKEMGDSGINWLYYFDEDTETLKPIPGRIDDTTKQFTQSGFVRFSIPFSIGPIPEDHYANLQDEVESSPADACNNLKDNLQTKLNTLKDLDPNGTDYLIELNKALTDAVSETSEQQSQAKPEIPHPIDPKLRDPAKIKGWLRIGPLDTSNGTGSMKLRMLTFNAATATHAQTTRSELLGVSDGRPGQQFRLAHQNVLEDTLEIAIQEQVDGALIPWEVVDSLDPAGPFDRVVQVDLEAGTLLFGDGNRGRIPPLVPGAGNIVAEVYRYGGGVNGNTDVGTITNLETQHVGIAGCTNFVSAQGGRDSETLEDAKVRARKELSTRYRAVTASDFEWLAMQTPSVRVAKVAVVPLRKPLSGTSDSSVGVVRCGNSLPDGPAGLDDTFVAHGAVSVVVVPDVEGNEPTPTPSFLRTVCMHLDKHRLVTTEVYVVPPQYMRICNVRLWVKAQPGYTRTQLQDLVEARLANYLHVLTGGIEGDGYPFGGQVHIADLMAYVFRTEGIDRVENITAEFSRTKSNANPRQGRLVFCAESDDEYELIDLAPEESVSLDSTTFTLTTVT